MLLSLYETIKKDPQFKGEKGQDAVVDYDALLAKMKADKAFLLAIAALVNVESPHDKSVDHMVLVADSKADYWSRLGDEYERARNYFSAFRLAPPPTTFSEPMPQLVLYRDGNPIKRYIGLREVSEALQKVYRGEFAL